MSSTFILPARSFRQRVLHDFRVYVLLRLKRDSLNIDDILLQIFGLPGYRCHRVVRYETNWSHIHIKFQHGDQARNAICFLRSLNPNFTVESVDHMLSAWYMFETGSLSVSTWTCAIVDVVGSPPINFLTNYVLEKTFHQFGEPMLLPDTAFINRRQFAFSSMSEALSACMAFGDWHFLNTRCDIFHYRVRINPGVKESMLIKWSGGIPEEAFKLEYFLCLCERNSLQSKSTLQNHVNTNFNEQLAQIPSPNESATDAFSRIISTPGIFVPVIVPPLNYSSLYMINNQPLIPTNLSVPVVNMDNQAMNDESLPDNIQPDSDHRQEVGVCPHVSVSDQYKQPLSESRVYPNKSYYSTTFSNRSRSRNKKIPKETHHRMKWKNSNKENFQRISKE